MLLTYHQVTGLLKDDTGAVIGVGYSGHMDGRNTPEAAGEHSIGPLPLGDYTIAAPVTHPTLGPLAYQLQPAQSNEMYGRGGFWIHGDNPAHPGLSSDGCIVMDRVWRAALGPYVGATIQVINSPSTYKLPTS